MQNLHSKLYKSIFENAQIGIALCNMQTNSLEMINATYASICGCDTAIVKADSCQCVFYSDNCLGKINNSMCTVYNMPFEMEFSKKDGSTVPIEVYTSILKGIDGVNYRQINVIDISSRKFYENKLLEREQSYRALVEFSPDMIARYDQDARLQYINPALSELLGRSEDEIIGTSPVQNLHSPFSLEYEQAIKRVFNTVVPEDFEYEFTDPSTGKDSVHMIRLVPELINEIGIPKYVIGIGRDITPLINNKKSLEEAQQIAHIGNWEIKYPITSLVHSKEISRIFELNTQQASDFDAFISCIHPDDRERVINSMNDAILKKQSFDITHRLLLKDGNIKYVHHLGKTIYDGENPVRTFGTTQDITKQKIAEATIEYMAFYDSLTGLPNRIMAKKYITEILPNQSRFAVLFIDLDGFKTINDTLGHSLGDSVLKAVSNKFHKILRNSDILYRLGGDEFILVIQNVENKENIDKILQKIYDEFQTPCQVLNHSFAVTMSIGIALYPEHGNSFETLLQRADMAMYKSKENGKNCYSFYTEQMNHHVIGEFKMLTDLKEALKQQQFILHYQPQIDLQTNKIICVEALIRWNHPILGMVSPIQFISIAEQNGLIVPIGEWVIREACRQAKKWISQGIDIVVAVNVSSVQFKRGGLKDIVLNALNEFQIPPHFLELELTESIIMNDSEHILDEIKSIKNIGVHLSIDDFGTGYSSLAYLKRFAVDKLKIDQSFIRELLNNQEDAVIVRAIIQMAKSLNLKIIAEGVENAEVCDFLAYNGCHEAQGYHFAKPMNSNDFLKYYLKHGNELV